jgi:chondroitin 4-sulfotransferase 11
LRHREWRLRMNDNSKLMWLRERIADLRGRGIYQGWANAHRAIFIHIPKTAGSSVSQSLFGKARSNPHAPYSEYERINPRKFRRYFKFTFVRNPWDRVVSSYFYLRDELGPQMSWYAHEIAPYPDFAGFVRSWLTAANVRSSVHFKPQHMFICDASLRLRVDFVGRVETIEADFRHVCLRLGVAAALDWTNRSNHRPYQDYYTDELQDIVGAVYANDIALFGYRFDAQPARPVL